MSWMYLPSTSTKMSKEGMAGPRNSSVSSYTIWQTAVILDHQVERPWCFLSFHRRQGTHQPSSLSDRRYASLSLTLLGLMHVHCTLCPIWYLVAILWKHTSMACNHLPGTRSPSPPPPSRSMPSPPWLPISFPSAWTITRTSSLGSGWKESPLQPVWKPARIRQQGTLRLVPEVLGPAGPAAVADEKTVGALNVRIRSPWKETSWAPPPRLLVHHDGHPWGNGWK